MKSRINWKRHLDAWSRSGLTKKEYCRRAGLSYQSFFFNRKRIEIKPSVDSGFIELHVKDHEHSFDERSKSLCLEIGNNLKLHICGYGLEEVLKALTTERPC
jgi:hypothetical protein